MNPYKLRLIVEFVRRNTPINASVTDRLRCINLDELLPLDELHHVHRELVAMEEAEAFIDRLRLHTERWA